MDKEKKLKDVTKYVKYNKKWEVIPEFEGWVSPLPGNPKSAYCKVCHRPLYPSKKDLIKHANSKKHKLNFARNVSFKDYCSTPSELIFDVVDNRVTHSIKCETIDSTLLHTSNSSSGDANEKQSLTIKLFPSAKGDDENMENILNESFTVVDDIPITDPMQTPIETMQTLPQYSDWLTIGESEASCSACNTKFKCTQIQIYKHSIGKIHLEKCVKKSYHVAENSSVCYDGSGSPIKLYPQGKIGGDVVIDLRSDSVTTPSDKMKDIIVEVKTDESFKLTEKSDTELQKKVARILKKDDGLLFPSGTMANMAAVITHCWSRDSEVILGDKSQLNLSSNSAITKLFSIPLRTIKNKSDGTFCLEELKEMMNGGQRCPNLICIENPVYHIGGKVLPLEWIGKVAKFCEENGVMLHMDGSRIFNASLYCGRTPDIIVQSCDSTTLCLDKGLGTPIGSVLVGSHPFIKRAKRTREMFGGYIPRMDMFADAGLHALNTNTQQLNLDHIHARKIAQTVKDLHSSAISVDIDDVQTNVIHLRADGVRVTASSFCERISQMKDSEEVITMGGINVLLLATVVNERTVRMVTHLNLKQIELDLALKKLILVINEYSNTLDSLQS